MPFLLADDHVPHRHAAVFRGQRRFTFDDEGVRCITPLSETHLRWAFYTGMIETDRCYVLMRRGFCTPIPKASFATLADADRFRTLAVRSLAPGN